eukprot:gnl/TRDRNA2_/TRDRNA2_202074_c0_seq1.p1 gnl/TRDRNA2_/TRDRNA2_202074_c0~~gnl/TRDRNA2_/TRDRNA2_202074_c0_seq1.p1  ORF type:complete len:369 (+),score=56.61 gnl/TRDRNA2_/TRDRNA2_202074_c0_seq1:65-1171(+)
MPDVQWPTPSALEGVKSRKNAIFKMHTAKVVSKKEVVYQVPGIALNLESRVAAVGDGGSVLVALLLGKLKPLSGATAPHAKLVVAHLGPHLAGADASMQQHAAAISVALKGGPQVVVLSEGLSTGGEAWAQIFREILRGGGIPSFKGAVVVEVAQETFAVRRVCVQRWVAAGEGCRLVQEAVNNSFEIIEDVKTFLAAAANLTLKKQGRQASQVVADTKALMEEVRELADAQFEQDIFDKANKEGHTITLLIKVSPEGSKALVGFMFHRLRQLPQPDLHISFLAITHKFRGRGFGRMLMDWVIGEAARMPQSKCYSITASALDKVVPFYEKLGFVAHSVHPEHPDGEDEEDPQTWVEFKNVSLISAAA